MATTGSNPVTMGPSGIGRLARNCPRVVTAAVWGHHGVMGNP
jgi:hypothetical protein